MLKTFIEDENGFIVSAEMVLIFTLFFCAVAVGMAVVKDALAHELGDVSEAIGALNQSYNFRGLRASLAQQTGNNTENHAVCSGSGFNDSADDCDCQGITLVTVAGKNDPSGGTLGDGANPQL